MAGLANLAAFLQYRDQAAGREEYKGLLDSYRVAGDPNAPHTLDAGPSTPGMVQQSDLQQRGGFRGENGLLSGGPPQDFYLRAGAIPGYQQMAMQAQVGQQGMDRQLNNQEWQETKMTAGQKAMLFANETQRTWENNRRVWEYDHPSAVQTANIAQGWGNLGVAQGNLALNQQRMQAEQNQAQLGRQFPALMLTGNDAIEFQSGLAKLDRASQIGTDVADYLQKVGVGEKALDRGTVKAMQASYQQHVVPALTEMVGTGTIQKGDMDFVVSVMGDPGAWKSLDSQERKKVMSVLTAVNDERGRRYSLRGERAPVFQPGQSAWARSESAPSAPPSEFLTPWSP